MTPRTEVDTQPKADAPKSQRKKLPDEMEGLTHRFIINGHKGYISLSKWPDGTPARIEIFMSKKGSTMYGVMKDLSKAISLLLKYGMPLEEIVVEFAGDAEYEPHGRTNNPCIPNVRSVTDYTVRWMAIVYLSVEKREAIGITTNCDGCPQATSCQRKE